jgi:hypothetical protein
METDNGLKGLKRIKRTAKRDLYTAKGDPAQDGALDYTGYPPEKSTYYKKFSGRAHARLNFIIPKKAEIIKRGICVDNALMYDLCAAGCRIKTEKPYTKNAKITLRFFVTDRSGNEIAIYIKGKLTNAFSANEFGVRFPFSLFSIFEKNCIYNYVYLDKNKELLKRG